MTDFAWLRKIMEKDREVCRFQPGCKECEIAFALLAVAEAAGIFSAHFDATYEVHGGLLDRETKVLSKIDILAPLREALAALRAMRPEVEP